MEQVLDTPKLADKPMRILAGQLAVGSTNLPKNMKGWTRTPPTGSLEWGDQEP